MGYTKIKNYFSSKNTIESKNQDSEWEEIFVVYIANIELQCKNLYLSIYVSILKESFHIRKEKRLHTGG